jgi:hypothetical protein
VSDPREVGLPPANGAPTFVAGEQSLHDVYTRHTRRRRKRFAVAGGSGAAAAAVVIAFVTANGSGSVGALEQDQPAHHAPAASALPTPMPGPIESPYPRPSTPAALATPGTHAGGHPQAPTDIRSGRNQLPTPGTAQARPDSTRVRRDRTTYAGQTCRFPAIQGWETTGWCFVAADVAQLTAGHTVTLTVSLCRNGTTSAQVRFPSRQQGGWDLWAGKRILWSSNEQGSPFTAGEVVTLAPNECLRWRVDWRVTTHGHPVPTGDYQLLWGTGADLRSPTGHAYHDESAVHVGPGSASGGIAPVVPLALRVPTQPFRGGSGPARLGGGVRWAR